MLKIIVIDPGHGGSDPGATQDDVQEAEIVLSISKKARNILEVENTYAVILTRSHSWRPPLSRRAVLANELKADIFVSIHCNSFSKPSVGGIETLYYPSGKKDKKLAHKIQEKFVCNLKRRDRGIKKRSDLYVLRETSIPSVLAEIGFISHPVERDLLQKDAFQHLAARSIKEGIDKYFFN